jgi:hypothetical protein
MDKDEVAFEPTSLFIYTDNYLRDGMKRGTLKMSLSNLSGKIFVSGETIDFLFKGHDVSRVACNN